VATLPPYRALLMQALDHAAGHLLAFGIAAVLCKIVTVRPMCVATRGASFLTHERAGGWLVARGRLSERDTAMDLALWQPFLIKQGDLCPASEPPLVRAV